MSYGGLRSVKEESYSFSAQDFGSITGLAQGFYAENGKLVPAYIVSETGSLKSGLTCVKAYDVGFKIYYCSDGKLYREKDGEFKAFGVPAMSSAPYIFSCTYEGSTVAAVVCGSGTYFLDDAVSFVPVPKGTAYTAYKGGLFVAKGNKIIVCGEPLYAESGISVNNLTSLYPAGRYGAVVDFAIIRGELYAVMKRGAVKIVLTGEDMGFSLIDCGLPPFKVVEGTCKSTGNEAYFFGVNGLNRFNGKRVEKPSSVLDELCAVPCGEAQVCDNLYLLPVMVNGERKIYCFDVISEKEEFLTGDVLLAGGSTVSPSSGKVGKISVSDGYRCWKSKEIDFKTADKKTVYSVSLRCKQAVEVTILGDGVKRTFICGGDRPEAHPAIRAEKFYFTFAVNGEAENSEISDFVVKYRR